jgi:hypothetical protein
LAASNAKIDTINNEIVQLKAEMNDVKEMLIDVQVMIRNFASTSQKLE